jgi:hypothetical protein
MIINNAKLVSADDPIKQWVYITLTVDTHNKYTYTHKEKEI